MTESKLFPTFNEKDTKSLQLEALKAIRESAYQRWEKRRGYEWQLSISIWTALAAFSGLVLGKDVTIQNQYIVAAIVAAFGGVISWIQRSYLSKMADHTIGDVHVQRLAEQKMYELAFDNATIPSRSVDSRLFLELEAREEGHVCYPPLSKYGFAQYKITIVLAAAAAAAVLAPHAPPPANPTAPVVSATPGR
jgi:hypothetical protein